MNGQQNSELKSFLAKIAGENREIKRQLSDVVTEYRAFRKACEDMPRSITHELDSIPGRRIFYSLNGVITFTISDDGRRGQPINFLVSQDGPFVQTHYPMVVWRPTAPATATSFGLWRPVSSWPLPDQAVSGAVNLDSDIVAISWELVDGGSQRNFQNLTTPPVLSRPDNMVPLPVPTLFAPNTTIQFFPTYQRILFNGTVAPTEGTLEVALSGYRIVNM